MTRALYALLGVAAAATGLAQDPGPALVGSVDGNLYVSPSGEFKMEIPVLPALGGVIHDTENVVTFRDNFGLQITVGAFLQDASQRWELSTRGNKDYLIYFFTNFVLVDLRRFCAESHIESAGYSSDLLDGALFTYVLLPGGSVFATGQVFAPDGPPPVAKRGNLVFVRNGYVYVISSELSERVTEGSHYKKTTEEEDRLLRARLVDIVKKIQFAKPAAPKAP